MDADKYSRAVTLLCPTCGHKDFEHSEVGGPVRCMSCDRCFTREELIRENGEVIEVELDEVKAEVLKDAKKELRDTLRNAFKGSKHIRFK